MGVVEEERATDKVREGGGLQEKGAVLWRQTAGKERTGQDRGEGGFYQRKERKLWHEVEEQRERKIEKEKQQTGIVPPGQTGGRREEAAMQSTMGISWHILAEKKPEIERPVTACQQRPDSTPDEIT
ncbi:unnamed protein product [Leuciscus chuanchicus]